MPCRNERGQMTQVVENIGAGEGNRTLVISLEGCCSTISTPFFPLHEKPVLAGTSRLVYGCEWSRDFRANARGNVTPASPRRSSCHADKKPHGAVRSPREAAGARTRRILRRSISRAGAARNDERQQELVHVLSVQRAPTPLHDRCLSSH